MDDKELDARLRKKGVETWDDTATSDADIFECRYRAFWNGPDYPDKPAKYAIEAWYPNASRRSIDEFDTLDALKVAMSRVEPDLSIWIDSE